MTFKKLPLTDEAWPTNLITGIIGPPQAGKTLYCNEVCYAMTEEGDEVLYIGTGDEPTSFFIDMWTDTLEKKYKHKIKMNFRYAPNATELLNLVGIKGEVLLGEKTEFQIKESNVAESELVKLLKKGKTKVIIVDSVTAPFDVLTVGGRQNLPLRAQVETVWFNAFTEAIRLSGQEVYILTTHHVTFNPTNPYEIKEHVMYKGGKIVGHYTKIVYALEHRDRPHGYRVMHVVRYPSIPEYGKSYDVLISSEGYKKTNKVEVEEMKKLAKEQKAAERGY